MNWYKKINMLRRGVSDDVGYIMINDGGTSTCSKLSASLSDDNVTPSASIKRAAFI